MREQAWHKEADTLYLQGYSGRKIADTLGMSKTQVNDYLRYAFRGQERSTTALNREGQGQHSFQTNKSSSGPKILVYDIETAPLKAHIWSMWQHGVGLNQIEDDWFIMSFAAKWLNEDEVFYFDQSQAVDMEDDYLLLHKLWNLLNEADIVIGQNVKKFDTRKVNARFILNGLPKPSTYRQIDTVEIAKQQFGFTSNKLEYMTDNLCSQTKKSKHQKFPGHVLWSECLKGNPEAWEEMKSYNIDDILATEELYNILSSWDNKLPNFDVYVEEILDMDEWEKDGYHYTNLGKYQRYRNKVTGIQRRSRVNLLSKEKRQSLLANIV
ncbi:MAG: ribonuclease H-like domain-containing protein [Gammaproteobacteria bacterium]|nr:ribonuclease H-like domain-containing protein [Gammaproteobacteria bacterium]